ncbi:hypothetical protein [Nostoc sp.]
MATEQLIGDAIAFSFDLKRDRFFFHKAYLIQTRLKQQELPYA